MAGIESEDIANPEQFAHRVRLYQSLVRMKEMAERIRYSTPQIALHWVVALLVVCQYLFNAPISAAWQAMSQGLAISFSPLIFGHVAGGMLILVFVVWRLILRAMQGTPPLLKSTPNILKLAASLTHWTLYGVLVAMVISGMAVWFGRVDAAAMVHGSLKMVLLALIGLHVLAVVFHHLVLKDNLMQRMLLVSKS